MLDEIRRAAGTLSEEGARSYLGRFLFSGDDVFKLVGSLSGGERSRVALAKLTLQGANFLVLDEPTNHLDLPARQALESILSGYDGTLLFVSHDRYFVDALATAVWTLDDGQITAHTGNYTAARTRRAQAEAAQTAQQERQARQAKAAARATAVRANQQGGGAVTADGPRTVAQLEREIEATERRLAQLERDLEAASAAAEVARIAELSDAYEDAKTQLDALYGEWEELAS
ncbi:MAG TPA: ATP-binding cassette domain-containing protein [Ktedonobacterales bacterium]|nr:ATP-binding cassette domain-containing protein [Ktedonobacterales bacterium]